METNLHDIYIWFHLFKQKPILTSVQKANRLTEIIKIAQEFEGKIISVKVNVLDVTEDYIKGGFHVYYDGFGVDKIVFLTYQFILSFNDSLKSEALNLSIGDSIKFEGIISKICANIEDAYEYYKDIDKPGLYIIYDTSGFKHLIIVNASLTRLEKCSSFIYTYDDITLTKKEINEKILLKEEKIKQYIIQRKQNKKDGIAIFFILSIMGYIVTQIVGIGITIFIILFSGYVILEKTTGLDEKVLECKICIAIIGYWLGILISLIT